MTSRPWREWGAAAGERGTAVAEFRAELPASLGSARQARAAVREALAAWGLDYLAGDAELLASELVANAAEHGDGQPIGLALRRVPGPRGEQSLVCEVTDTSPAMPMPRDAEPDAERGRGLSIVSALARTSGVTPSLVGKTAWFTLATPDPSAEADAEAEVGLSSCALHGAKPQQEFR